MNSLFQINDNYKLFIKRKFFSLLVGLFPILIIIYYLNSSFSYNSNNFFKLDYFVTWSNIIIMSIWTLAIFVLPNIFIISCFLKKTYSLIEYLMLSFVLGLSISVLIGLSFKYLNLNYSRTSLLLAYTSIYFLFFVSFRLIKGRFFTLPTIDYKSYCMIKSIIPIFVLLLIIILKCYFILKTRASSYLLYGDERTHMYMIFSLILDGPFYDKFFCYNEFFPNWYAGGFHNWITILSSISKIDLKDISRYVPLLICPFWIMSLYVLAKKVIKDNIAAVLVVFFALGVSRAEIIPFAVFFQSLDFGLDIFLFNFLFVS